MALADIIGRIESEAQAQAERILSDAQARAELLEKDAQHAAAEQREQSRARARLRSESEAATLVASARLAARDATLSARRELVEEALSAIVSAVESLPSEHYVRFLAVRIAENAHGGESVAFAERDATLRDAVFAAVRQIEPALELSWDGQTAVELSRGAVLVGDRVSSTISAASVVADRRGELELTIAARLFGDGEA